MAEEPDSGKMVKGPLKGEFIAPPEEINIESQSEELPEQEDFWRPPVRFGSVPVEKEPLGWDRRRGFRKLFPVVSLPTQVVERVSFGHPDLEPNRLFWGDNLHVMRQLPSESIDLIYIDPPFFSGRQYNVIFGDQNELRSFSDIWEGGMPGYLIWLNARLYEMKRLLKRTGSLVVHLDWHSVHYVKAELDKVFGHDNFHNDIVWHYRRWTGSSKEFLKMHDDLLWYSKGRDYYFEPLFTEYTMESAFRKQNYHTRIKGDDVFVTSVDKRGVKENDFWEIPNLDSVEKIASVIERLPESFATELTIVYLSNFLERSRDKLPKKTAKEIYGILNILKSEKTDTQFVSVINSQASERIGYPTQKPEPLIERLIRALTPSPDKNKGAVVVADFFCGGGTTPAVAQRLNRKWICCDQSRVAVAITADRISQLVEKEMGRVVPVPDFTTEHWGIYEAERLSRMPVDQFRAFIVRAFGAVPDGEGSHIHGYKGAVPVWVGEPSQRNSISAKQVEDFANAVRKTVRYRQDNLRDGIMLAWAFRPDAIKAAEHLRQMERTELNFIRIEQIRVDSPRFREHIAALSTDNADYQNFLTFVQPPKVEVGWRRLSARVYKFDVSETAVLNVGAKIINVQWDFDYGKRFSSTQGYSFVRGQNKEPALQVQYEFPRSGKFKIACKVQDDMGGEGLWAGEIEVN